MANFMADNIPAVLVSAKSDSPLCFSAQNPTPVGELVRLDFSKQILLGDSAF